MKLDEKALEAAAHAYESPWNKRSLAVAIEAYLTAAPPAPVGEVMELVEAQFARSIEPPTAEEVAGNLRDWANALTIPSGDFVNDDLRYAASFIESLSERLAEADRARLILAHTDIGSLPNDWTLEQIAEARIDDLIKLRDQVRDTCRRAESAEARLAECERERDEARNAAVESSGIAGEACIRATNARARVEALEKALKPFADIAQYIEEHCHDIDDNDETSVSIGDLFAARAALNKGEG